MSRTFEDLIWEKNQIFNEKGIMYGHSYKDFGKVMISLFPNGVELKTEQDFCIFAIFQMIIHKNVRVANMLFCDLKNSLDSLADLSVYGVMLEEIVYSILEREIL